MIKQSFSFWGFAGRGVDDLTLLREAKAIGYDGVELLDPSLFPAAIDAGLTIVSHMGHGSIGVGLNDPSRHTQIEDEIRGNLETAVKYGIPSLIVFSGDRRPGLTDAEGLDHTALGLSRVAKAAEDAGVTLLLELLNSKVDHRGYQADHTAWAVEVCKRVGSPRVKVLYDIYHMQIMEGDLIRTIQGNHEHIGHYHTAGVPGRGGIDPDTQEISYAPVFRAIAETGYAGCVGHEFVAHDDPVSMLEAAYVLTRAAGDHR